MWNPPTLFVAYQHMRTVSSIAPALHFCEGILCNSAPISSARASAIVDLPSPEGPRNSHAQDTGLRANAESTLRCFSNPIKSAMRRGLYFSASGCGDPKDG